MDPRPLTGEPLALDLLNTEWMLGGVRQDLFALDGGLAIWLSGHGLPDDPSALEPLLSARKALRAVVLDPSDRTGFNAVLAHARVRLSLEEDGPGRKVEADPGWLPACLAAENYLSLLEERPDRIRPCGNPECILHFYDISKNGTRRWCSMAGCGNRAKASRHYARHRQE